MNDSSMPSPASQAIVLPRDQYMISHSAHPMYYPIGYGFDGKQILVPLQSTIWCPEKVDRIPPCVIIFDQYGSQFTYYRSSPEGRPIYSTSEYYREYIEESRRHRRRRRRRGARSRAAHRRLCHGSDNSIPEDASALDGPSVAASTCSPSASLPGPEDL